MKSKVNNINFWNLWSSYASFYFGKVNLSIVIPVLLATYPNLSLYNVGIVSTGFMLAYALGQFIHGQVSERYNPFVYICIGLFGSAIMGIFLGFMGSFFWILLIGEIIDGGFQSMGWSSTVRANALTSSNIEKSSVYLGTSYQVGNSIAWIVCGFMIGRFGWEWGFWTGTIVMTIRAISLYLTKPKLEVTNKSIKEQVRLTLSFPIIMSAISYFFLNMIRYGVITWIPTFLYRQHSMPIEKVGVTIFLIPLAGILGTLLYNRTKISREVLTIIYMLGLTITLFLMPSTIGIQTIGLIVLSGFFLYGSHVFLVSTMPSRFINQKIVASATGFIDGCGYIGSALIGILVPFLLDKTGNNWNTVFYFWASISIVIIGIVIGMYIKSKHKKRIVVYAFAVGDLLHLGHLKAFQQAKGLGTYLIVGILTDKATEVYKRKSIIPFEERVELVSQLKCVDKVVPQYSVDPTENLKLYKPDIVVHGDDWEEDFLGAAYMRSIGKQAVRTKYFPCQSTTMIINEVIKRYKENPVSLEKKAEDKKS